MSPFLYIFVMLALVISAPAHAQWDNAKPPKKSKRAKKKVVKKKKAPKKAAPKIKRDKEFKNWDLGAIPVGGLVGFGLGHYMQDRYVEDYGYAFTALDSAIIVFGVFGVFSSCVDGDTACEDDKDELSDDSITYWWISRAAQAFLLTRFYSKHKYVQRYEQPRFQFALVPTKKGGLQSQLTWSF